jgi:hypothetical protein
MSAEASPLLRCTRCGWVHFALTAEDILPGADQERLRHCFNCRAPVSALEFCSDDAAPRGVTIQGILYERV